MIKQGSLRARKCRKNIISGGTIKATAGGENGCTHTCTSTVEESNPGEHIHVHVAPYGKLKVVTVLLLLQHLLTQDLCRHRTCADIFLTIPDQMYHKTEAGVTRYVCISLSFVRARFTACLVVL